MRKRVSGLRLRMIEERADWLFSHEQIGECSRERRRGSMLLHGMHRQVRGRGLHPVQQPLMEAMEKEKDNLVESVRE